MTDEIITGGGTGRVPVIAGSAALVRKGGQRATIDLVRNTPPVSPAASQADSPPSTDAGAPPQATGAEDSAAGESFSTEEYFDHEYQFSVDHLDDASYEAVGRWGEFFQRNEIPAPVAEGLVGYVLNDLPKEEGELPPAVAHQYRIGPELGFRDADIPNLTRVLNKLAELGASDRQVWAILQAYRDGLTHAEKEAIRNVKRNDWGAG